MGLSSCKNSEKYSVEKRNGNDIVDIHVRFTLRDSHMNMKLLDFANIDTIGIDVDGTLTDGIYTVSDQGVYSKSFHTKDFYAIEKALKNKIRVIIITQSHDKVIQCRINNICEGSQFWRDAISNGDLIIYTGIHSKLDVLKTYAKYHALSLSGNFAYIGDADNDIPVMQESYFTACPQDAWYDVKEESNYISPYLGGRGAVFDIINYILEKRENKNDDSKT
jgi:3-deoxy-D-manno-octulosonate 8-phosphate phosphatase (KDO 8-P phosphatase)